MAVMTVEEYLAALDEPRRSTAVRLREVVRGAAPEARESIKWAQPVYELNGPFAAIQAFPKHVTLTFWRGALLSEKADRTGLLEGDSKRMRHIRFSSPDEIGEPELAALVAAAVALNAEFGDPTMRR